MQESVALRTLRVAQINTILTAQGGLPLLKIFGSDPPLNVAAADPANLLCTITLPASPLSASNGVASMIGNWAGSATNGGYAQSFRLYDWRLDAMCKAFAASRGAIHYLLIRAEHLEYQRRLFMRGSGRVGVGRRRPERNWNQHR